MPLKQIIDIVAKAEGFNNLTDNTDARQVLVDIINEACEEVYETTDLAGSLQEITATVDEDIELALPSYVGEIRGVRPANDTENVWRKQTLIPRYTSNNWAAKEFALWRMIG